MLSLLGHLDPHMGLCPLKLTKIFSVILGWVILCMYQHHRGIITIKDTGSARKSHVLKNSGVQHREKLASYFTPTALLSTP